MSVDRTKLFCFQENSVLNHSHSKHLVYVHMIVVYFSTLKSAIHICTKHLPYICEQKHVLLFRKSTLKGCLDKTCFYSEILHAFALLVHSGGFQPDRLFSFISGAFQTHLLSVCEHFVLIFSKSLEF